MRHRTQLILCSAAALVLVFLLFTGIEGRAAAPVPIPSVPGGYYREPFTLTLSAPSGGTLYYTTDGSLPTEDSPVYRGGIAIADRSQEPNVIRSVRNVVPDWQSYTPDPANVSKGTVIRAIYVSPLGVQSDVLTQTYFVGLEPPSHGYTLSLSAAFDDLFGEDGICVTGREYDRWYLSSDRSGSVPEPNFEKDTEVPVTVELMDAQGDVLNQEGGIRLQGASARSEVSKRFTLTARTEYSGSKLFDISLFEGVSTHSVMLKSYLPDAICAALFADRSASLQRSHPVRVFVNGEYLYDAFMLERYDSEYFRQHYQIDDAVVIKNGVSNESGPETPQQDAYEEFLYWVRHTDFTDPVQWEQIQKEISLSSYIDYLIANYFLCNIDFNDIHNHVLWRSATLSDKPYGDMRWRWCLYDVDALEWIRNDPDRGKPETINIFSNEVGMDLRDASLYQALKPNPEFRRQFVLAFLDVLNNNLSPQRVGDILEQYGADIHWQEDYFLNRPAYAVEHLAEEFTLTGEPQRVTVSTAHSEMGTVTVNTSQISFSSGVWQGIYFADYPITVTAEAKEGYQFLGWKGGANTDQPSVTLSVDGGVALEALFAEKHE